MSAQVKPRLIGGATKTCARGEVNRQKIQRTARPVPFFTALGNAQKQCSHWMNMHHAYIHPMTLPHKKSLSIAREALVKYDNN
jgi:hypothetical protein